MIPKSRWPKGHRAFQGWFHTLDAFEAGPVAAYAAAYAVWGVAMAVRDADVRAGRSRSGDAVLSAASEASDRALLARPGRFQICITTRQPLSLRHDDERIAALVTSNGGARSSGVAVGGASAVAVNRQFRNPTLKSSSRGGGGGGLHPKCRAAILPLRAKLRELATLNHASDEANIGNAQMLGISGGAGVRAIKDVGGGRGEVDNNERDNINGGKEPSSHLVIKHGDP